MVARARIGGACGGFFDSAPVVLQRGQLQKWADWGKRPACALHSESESRPQRSCARWEAVILGGGWSPKECRAGPVRSKSEDVEAIRAMSQTAPVYCATTSELMHKVVADCPKGHCELTHSELGTASLEAGRQLANHPLRIEQTGDRWWKRAHCVSTGRLSFRWCY